MRKVKKIVNKCVYWTIILMTLLALMLSAARLCTPFLAKYRVDVEQLLSASLGDDVRIGSLKASWYGARPMLQLNDVSIHTKNTHKKTLSIRSLSIGFNLWQSLWQQGIQPGILLLDGADIQISQKLGHPYQLHGFERLLVGETSASALPNQIKKKVSGNAFDEVIPNEVLSWFFHHNEVRLSNLHVQFKTDNITLNTEVSRLKLLNNETGHHLEGVASLSDDLNTQFRLVGHAKGERLNQLSGDFYVKLKKMPLVLLSEALFKRDFIIKSGNGDMELWGKLFPNYSLSAQANVLVSNAVFNNVHSMQTKTIKFFKGTVAFHHNNEKTRFFSKHLEFSPYLKFNKEHSFLWEKKGSKLILQASYLNLLALSEWAQFFEIKALKKLTGMHFHGDLNDAQLHFLKGKPSVFFAKLHNVGAHERSHVSFNNISGELYADKGQGYLKLQSNNTSVSMPPPYDKAFMLRTLKGEFRWINMSGFWRISSDNAFISTDNVSISQHFSLDWTGDIKTSFLSLSLDLTGERIEELKPYLPKKGMSQALRSWFNHALISVPSINGNVILKGRLGAFPFDKEQGDFQATLHTQNATLKYHKDWPLATKIDANLVFSKRVMLAEVTQAVINKNKISNVSILIKPLGTKKQSLLLKGEGMFHSNRLVELLLNSPLKDKLLRLSSMTFEGMSDLTLNLTIPLYPNEKDKPLFGNIRFIDNTLSLMKEPDINLTSLKGALLFNEKGIVNSQLSSQLFSYPLSLSLSNEKTPSKGLMIKSHGKMAMNKLKEKFPLMQMNDLNGFFNYDASIFIPDNTALMQVDFHSDLLNLKSDLPSPLSKKIGKKQSTFLKATIAPKNISMHLSLDKRFNARINLKRLTKSMSLERAHVSFLGNHSQLPRDPVLLIDGRINHFSIHAWRDWLTKQSETEKEVARLSLPLHLKVNIGQLDLYQQSFKAIYVSLMPGIKGQVLTFNSERIKGRAYLPNALFDEGLNIQLDYLHLNKKHKKARVSPMITVMPKWPPLKVRITKLSYNNQLLGRLAFKSHLKDKAFIIHELSLHSPSYEMKLVGQWLHVKDKPSIQLEGYWQSKSLANALRQWGVEPIVESKKATLTFILSAEKSLFDFNLEDLKGKLKLIITNGRITQLSKKVEERLGLGKLISILSLQTLPRRLSLDFSDLSSKGFSFDVFKGDFNLRDGNLHTSNSFLDGPVSYVSMKGRLNVVKKQYDLTLKIMPHITASLPVVATIAGGPLAGIAAWVASKIINQTIQKVNSYTYKIKGPWKKPAVHQISISNAVKKK